VAWFRRGSSSITSELRSARPRPRDQFVRGLVDEIQAAPRRLRLRKRLVPVLVSLGLLGGAAFLAVAAVAASASGQQYCPPGGSCSNGAGAIVILTCSLSNGGHTLTVTGTTTDKINPITVSDTPPPTPAFSTTATFTQTTTSPYGFTATFDASPAKFSGTYHLVAVQTLGGTAKADCTV
jgi:hypothetical protein